MIVPGAGTFNHQYLGKVTGLPFRADPIVQLSSFGPSPNVVTSNLELSSTGPDGTVLQSSSARFVYADITVSSAATPTTGLVLTFSQNGVALLAGLDQLTVATSSSSQGCPADVSSQIKITTGTPVQLFGTQLWTEVVTLQNLGQSLTGPLQLALENLSANARVFGASAIGSCPGIQGAALQTVSGNGLAANATVKAVITFTNSLLPTSGITFQPVVVSGGNQL